MNCFQIGDIEHAVSKNDPTSGKGKRLLYLSVFFYFVVFLYFCFIYSVYLGNGSNTDVCNFKTSKDESKEMNKASNNDDDETQVQELELSKYFCTFKYFFLSSFSYIYLETSDPYKRQKEAMAKEEQQKSEKSSTPDLKADKPDKEASKVAPISNPYRKFTKKKSSSTKKVAASLSPSKSKISGVRSRRASADSVGSQQRSQQDSRYMQLLFSSPVADEPYEKDGVMLTPWKFCVCVRAMNTRVAGKAWFEMRPEVNVNVHELVYDFFKSNRPIKIGSFDKYTECIVEGISKVVPVRKNPEEDVPYTITSSTGQEYDVMQMSGICEIVLCPGEDISKEIPKIAEEYKKMIQDRRYKDIFRMASWWTYCNPNKTTAEIVETIDGELYKDSFYSSWVGKHRGGVYPLLLNDRSRIFTSVLPNCRVESKFSCALDEMLMNRDIRVVVYSMLGEYDDDFKSLIFKNCSIDKDISFLL